MYYHWEPTTFISRACNPYLEGLKAIFHGFGVQQHVIYINIIRFWFSAYKPIMKHGHTLWPCSPQDSAKQQLFDQETRFHQRSPSREMWQKPCEYLPGWWLISTHLKTIRQNGFIFPKVRGENNKCLKQTPSYSFRSRLRFAILVSFGDLLLSSCESSSGKQIYPPNQ